LTHDQAKRLGCLWDRAEGVKKHKWFKGLEWDQLFMKNCNVPYLPPVERPDDTSMFDRYPDSNNQPSALLSQEDDALFHTFGEF